MSSCKLICTIRKIKGDFHFTVAEEIHLDISQEDKETIRKHFDELKGIFIKYDLNKIPEGKYKRIGTGLWPKIIANLGALIC